MNSYIFKQHYKPFLVIMTNIYEAQASELRKVNYEHYRFSNESKMVVLEFYDVAKNKTPYHENLETLKLLLPKNKLLVTELNELRNNDVIDLTGDVTCINNTNILSEVSYIKSSLPENQWTINDVVDTIKEYLEIENGLNNKIITKLLSFNKKQLKEAFILLSKHLDKDITCKFGNSIISYNSTAYIQIITQFVRYILLPKLFLEQNAQTHLLLTNYLIQYPRIICEEFNYKLSKNLNNTKYIQDNLIELSNIHKQIILKELLLHCTKLEKKHLGVIDCLLSNEIDMESIQKLIELLMAASSIFSNDKIFGRFLLNLISNCKGGVKHFEQQFVHIINLHRSVWKGKLSKALNSCLHDNSPLSQSMRY